VLSHWARRLDAIVEGWAGRIDDAVVRRQVRAVALVYVVVSAACAVAAVGIALIGETVVAIGAALVAVAHAGLLPLIRAGRPRLASWISGLSIIGATQMGVILTRRIELAPMVLVTVQGWTTPRRFQDLTTLALMLLVIIVAATVTGARNRYRDQTELIEAVQRAGSLADHLAEVNAELEERVSTRTRELEQALREQHELVARLDDLVQRDELTGLHNRRRLMASMLHPEVKLHPHCLILADIDHFKRINDTYGHQAGDASLKAVALTLASAVRDQDVVARIGGEEFAVLLPGTDLATASRIADRLRVQVAAIRLPATGSEQLTLSMGIADCKGRDCPMHGSQSDHRELLMHRADLALYQAKALGRNRVEVSL
jgi:diguanylate cyclase (GGDEF)-like protein